MKPDLPVLFHLRIADGGSIVTIDGDIPVAAFGHLGKLCAVLFGCPYKDLVLASDEAAWLGVQFVACSSETADRLRAARAAPEAE